MKITFTKMHGIGNDFVLINCIQQDELLLFSDDKWQSLSKKLCQRQTGIGADQILLLMPSDTADFRMRIFNKDGSEVEMCGNGIRCLARYIWDNGFSHNETQKKVLNVETLGGIKRPRRNGDLITVDMGEPKLIDNVINKPLNIGDKTFNITCVSMGNPHAVIVIDDVLNFPVANYGAKIETHEFFPNRTNVEFIEIIDKQTIKMRVWERGSGETLACGTGACASVVASNLLGLTGQDVRVILNGGELNILLEGGSVFMTGAGVKVFTGNIDI
jgi:diaminopimelate epimerase